MPLATFCVEQARRGELLATTGLPTWCIYRHLRYWTPSKPLECLVWMNRESADGPWLNSLDIFNVRHAIGPLIGSRFDWERMREIYRQTHVRCEVGALVRVAAPDVVASIPGRYQLAVDVSSPKFNPWSFAGRDVWIVGAKNQRVVWERYCELRVVGVNVVGMLLPPIRSSQRMTVVGGDLRIAHDQGVTATECERRSINTVRDFWLAASRLYDE